MRKGQQMSNEQRKRLSESAKKSKNTGRFKKGHICYCLHHTEESKRKIGLKNRINSLGNKNRLGSKVTAETRKKISIANIGKIISDETRLKISKSQKGKIIREETRAKMRKVMLGNNNGTGKRKNPFSKEHRKNLSKAGRGKHNGDKSPSWKGGITPENHKVRTSIEYGLWRESVFARDNWTCQKYGIKGGILHSHHIKNFSDYPELRFAIDNGITFSKKAHNGFHRKYGYKNNTEEQIKEFLNN